MNYPPDKKECQRLFEELRQLDTTLEGNEHRARKYEIIHDLAEAHFYEAKSYFIAGLINPDPDYRWTCISALVTHWQDRDPQIVSRLLDIAKNDPDLTVQDIALGSLGTLKVQEALPLLKHMVENDKTDPDIRKTAYLSILKIFEYPPQEIQTLWKDFTAASIDWNLLRTISELD